MADRYAQLTRSRAGALTARALGLPRPVVLERHQPGSLLITGPVIIGEAPGGVLAQPAIDALTQAGVAVSTGPVTGAVKALILDASGIASSRQLLELQRFFHPAIGHLQGCG